MTLETRLRLPEIEQRVCDLASEQLAMPRSKVSPGARLIEDLDCDSLDLVELIAECEETFGVTLPNAPRDPVYKSVFTRRSFRLADLAELIYLRQGMEAEKPVGRKQWRRAESQPAPMDLLPFSQLDGVWDPSSDGHRGLFEELAADGPAWPRRRRTDGMRCVLLSGGEVEIGCESNIAFPDEGPVHTVELDPFLIDAELVSTAAYCRFLNSTGESNPVTLADWFLLRPGDDRQAHMLIERDEAGWRPLVGAETWPMILVSWHGANAYSLWANGHDWSDYRDEHSSPVGCFLPSEAQWEYAARGPRFQEFPWGGEEPTPDRMRFARHRRSLSYEARTLPLAAVNERLGMSPFGLHHMAGNVWQWCRDWHDASFYKQADARGRNPVNRERTGTRSERGGSWIGPAELCRSSYRRGRNPLARGRCLGFRCVGVAAAPGARA